MGGWEEANITVRICLINGKKFENEVKNNQVCFAIIPRGSSVGSIDRATEVGNGWVTTRTGDIDWVPVEIIELLNEFKDIIVEDISYGLPPVRSIIHCMDLIPRASFPNKAPYRLTPVENEELNRQVHELLQKVLIR